MKKRAHWAQNLLGASIATMLSVGLALAPQEALASCERYLLSSKELEAGRHSATRDAYLAIQSGPAEQTKFNETVATLAVQLSELEILDLIQSSRKRISELEALSLQAQNCGRNGSCLIDKVKRFQINLHQFVKSTLISLGGEKRAKDSLRKLFLAQQASESDQTPDAVSLSEFERLSRGERLGLRSAATKIMDSVHALSFRELRQNPVARANLRKDLSITLGYQAAAQALILLEKWSPEDPLAQATYAFLSNPNWSQAVDALHQLSISTQWSLFPLTILMMSLQENQAAKHQTISVETDERDIVNRENLLLRLPRIVQGREGYWTEAKVKLHSFLALLPFEWAAVNVFSALRTATNLGADAMITCQAHTAMVNGVSLAIFGTYLAVKWAFLEKMVNLGLLPVVRKGYLQVAEEALQDLRTAKELPDEVTLNQFARAYEMYASSAEDPKLQGLLGRLKKWRARLPIGKAIPEADWVKIVNTPEAREVFSKYRQNRKVFLTEWAWRASNRLFDARLVFGLFGDIVPRLLPAKKECSPGTN